MTVPFKGGAPRKYEPEEFTQKIIEYFQYIDNINKERKLMDEKPKPFTISGICVFMDITRDTWSDYSKIPEYTNSIKKAKLAVEEYIEEGMINGSLSTVGAIFNLKNNFGWTDVTKIDNTTRIIVGIEEEEV